MKRKTMYIAATLVAALTVGVMAGCSSQPASSASASASGEPAASSAAASEASASASSEAAGQSTEELIAELKAAVANAPAFKSVTVNVEEESAFGAEDANSSASASAASSEAAASDAAAEPETITSTSVYKFDASGDKLKTSVESEVEGIKLQYFTDGDDAVFVTDGPVYSGTTEQFDLSHTEGFEAYFTSTIGDLSTLADCAASIEKMESNGIAFYMVTLDPQKYMASDELLTAMADSGDPVKQALLTVGFEEDGSLTAVDLGISYESGVMAAKHLLFSDYDSTVIDPMPKADKTYEEMEADIQEKLEAFEKELEEGEASEAAEASSAAAEAK